MLKKWTFFILLCSYSLGLQAQQELGLHLMRDVWQSSRTNPALVPDQRIFVGLPNVYFNYFHTAGTINELIVQDDGRNILNVDRLIELAEDNNRLNIDLEVETLHLGFRIGQFALSLNHAVKSINTTRYAKTLPQLFWQGNSQFIGQTISFGPDQQSIAFNEFGLGVAYELGNLTIGGRAKLLSGIGDASTPQTDASLTTDADIYQLELLTNYQINTSRFSPTFLFDSLDNIGIEYSFDELFDFNDLFSSNSGFAFDLGLRYQWGEKLELAASAIDIGQINWTENIINYRSEGTFGYDGLELDNILQDGQLDFEGTLDTLEDIFDFKESSDGYSTRLPAKFYLSALYQLTERWRLGAMYYSEHFRGQSFTSVAVNATTDLGKYFTVGASYAVRNNTYANIGLQVTARMGSVQVFAMSDNVAAAFRPYDSENVNGRIGLNLLFN
ncbi:MAG: DUF5723 family protein [Bacteroidota bacterium]